MSMISEFQKFVAKGNVMDLAVGVIIGGAFGKIVTALVDNVIMPPIGMALGGNPFEDLKIVLKEADEAAETAEVAINFGVFLGEILNFIIIAFVIFMMVRWVNNIRTKFEKKEEEPATPKGPTQEELLSEIRDLLKSNSAN